MTWLSTLLPATVIICIMVLAVYRYATTPGSSLLTAFRGSMTLLWSHLMMLVTAAGELLLHLADTAGDPTIDKYLHDVLTPERFAYLMLAAFLVNTFARGRSLPK